MTVWVVLWNEPESRECGELEAICSTQERAERWCVENDYDFQVGDNERLEEDYATVLIKEMAVIE